MSDIQAGDRVVCVDVSDADGPSALRRKALSRLTLGRAYRVTQVGSAHLIEGPAIGLAGVRNSDLLPEWRDLWRAHRFRKIRPAEDEFTSLIRKMKPVKAKEEA
jgi:hypothetical protein